ncbi:glycosyl transferase family 1 [Pseudomonas sp. FW306-02-F02-AA]|uniref:Glycosyl transferase family 1 n=1 Tax=Pseudomonas fluorescens TaxID=294 RepID=A0A0N9WEX2_PSEFL|nr:MULTISPECIES: glycosyltransferase family 4 protein [Pseudomonas]ALI01439.1 glycosyl transferase family 1 [Pseudomonas fluorescens]PMZ05847.1 glycosyl transferase family 1 [Pseudomonas sp. FW306-02-F02-AB]PMZ11417.1 glycosyl transferase family 1 [Pseudomonas sp. FW306-02-H06C]PMZ17340.1 glycosyl transferase family 1 [Pseudomonas sp. FW306-02-F02-AA]PMZ23057.1 glycosyl transferase family 1 [Pseudomonas sp. FW306-02-F08-AA]
MRVLHFFKTYLPDSVGGIEQVIFQLCESGAQHGIESQVLTLSANPSPAVIQLGQHEVHRAKLDVQFASTGFSYSVFKQFREMAAEADVVNYHFPWPFMDLVHFFSGMNKPCVVTYHSDIIRQKHLLKLYQPLMNRFLASADRIVAASPNYLHSSDILQSFPDKTRVIPYGLNKSGYPKPDTERMARWRERLGERFFLFVGVMRYYKGLHILLDALKGVDYPVVIVGAGPLEKELHAQAARLGLRNLHFLGRLDDEDKVALLQLSYAIVFPSHLRSEAFGISLLEGAMYGKPMISSEIGTGTSYINIHSETGLVVPPSDPQAFREAMRTLWENPLQAAEMGVKAEARYQQLFTADEMGRKWTELYQELLAEKSLSYA